MTMTDQDDIVTRLRHIADELQHNDYRADLFEAADEIERLRNDIGDILALASRSNEREYWKWAATGNA